MKQNLFFSTIGFTLSAIDANFLVIFSLSCVSCVDLSAKDQCRNDRDCLDGFVCNTENRCTIETSTEDDTIVIEVADLAFDPTPVSSSGAMKVLTITNTGKTSTQALALSLDDDSHFSILNDSCSDVELEIDKACTVEVLFKPIIEGFWETMLTVTYAPGTNVTAALSGIGKCACEFETCFDVCCDEGLVCGWTDTCRLGDIKLLPLDGSAEDYFGYSVSISGDVAIIGAFGDDDNGTDSGSAYIFERNESGNWTQKTKLIVSDGAANDYVGYSVSVSDDVVVVGAPNVDDNGEGAGAAYMFERDESGIWKQKSKLLAYDGAAGDSFGRVVSVSGDVALIGAWGDNDHGQDAGSAFIFERDESGIWIQKKKLLAYDGAAGDHFGKSLSVSGGIAIIGAWGDDDKGTDSGSAYIFERNEFGDWIEKNKLIALDGAQYDMFGYEVSVSGDMAVIGAYGDDDNGELSGSAYIFERSEPGVWVQKSKLMASDGDSNDQFGRWSVSIRGPVSIIGARGDGDNGLNSGSAYVFVRDGSGNWAQKSKLMPSDGDAEDGFGVSIAIDEDAAIIGASRNDDNGEQSGSAYIF